MKKIIVRILIAVVVLIILCALAIHFFLDAAVKRGVERVGPMLTKVEVKVDSVSLSLLSGSGKIKGMLVGNPEGYKSPSAISVGTTSLSVKPSSLFADKTVVREINVQGPEITFETDLRGNNLKKILNNIEETTGGGGTVKEPAPPKDQAKAAKKLQVDDFFITGGKINVRVTGLVDKSATVPLPEIHLQNLGTNAEGITVAELSKEVLKAIIKKAEEQAASAVTDLTKNAAGLTKDIGLGTNTLEKATKGIGDILKKKK